MVLRSRNIVSVAPARGGDSAAGSAAEAEVETEEEVEVEAEEEGVVVWWWQCPLPFLLPSTPSRCARLTP